MNSNNTEEKKNFHENYIEGRNAVLEAFRSGKTIDKIYVLDGCQDGPVKSITREARKHDAIINYVNKERLDQMSDTGKHQGVIAVSAAYEYAEVEDILANADKKGEPPFVIILDGIEDPHNLGAIIRTANQAGAHGIIIPKRRGRTYSDSGKDFGRCDQLYPCCKGDQYFQYYKGIKGKGHVVRMRRYGRHYHV